jgi:uncharacterized membrane protein
MALQVWQFVNILLAALVTGVFWGPWLGLSRSMETFPPEVFLAIGHRMIRNLAPIMPILMPATLLSTAPILLISYGDRPTVFYATLGGLALFVVALAITLMVEVPIDNQIRKWTVASLPGNWRQLRTRWAQFHVARTVATVAGLALMIAAAVFG